jgi:O-antigen ligase
MSKLLQKKTSWIQKWFPRLLFGGLIFSIPSNLFFKFAVDQAYITGLLVDYLLPKFYLSDIFIVGLLVWWGSSLDFKKWSFRKVRKWDWKIWGLIAFVLSGVIYQFEVAKPVASLWYLLKIIEMGLLGVFLCKQRKLIKKEWFSPWLEVSLVIQSLIGIYQFHFQKSLFGFWFLGEPDLSNYLGLAKGVFDGAEKILPYGTTPHPNILAGFLVWGMVMMWWVNWRNGLRIGVLSWITALSLYTLWLTQSISAWLSLGLVGGGVLLLKSKWVWSKKFSLLLEKNWRKVVMGIGLGLILVPLVLVKINSDGPSITRRNYLNRTAWQMFIKNPVWGVGLNNFTVRVEEYGKLVGGLEEVLRFVQPVHHVGLLVLSETGVWGVGSLVILGWWLGKNTGESGKEVSEKRLINGIILMMGLLPIMALDHYLITGQIGLIMLLVSVLFICNKCVFE